MTTEPHSSSSVYWAPAGYRHFSGYWDVTARWPLGVCVWINHEAEVSGRLTCWSPLCSPKRGPSFGHTFWLNLQKLHICIFFFCPTSYKFQVPQSPESLYHCRANLWARGEWACPVHVLHTRLVTQSLLGAGWLWPWGGESGRMAPHYEAVSPSQVLYLLASRFRPQQQAPLLTCTFSPPS